MKSRLGTLAFGIAMVMGSISPAFALSGSCPSGSHSVLYEIDISAGATVYKYTCEPNNTQNQPAG